MTALVYPSNLPGPIALPQQRAERRALTGLPGPRAARALWRDRLDPSVPITFRFRTPEQAAQFVEWLHTEQIDAGAWFAADWRVPQGDGGVFRFLQLPAFPQWLAPSVWECSGTVEIRGRSLPPTDGAAVDPYFDHVGYLLHFDEADSPQSFPDVKGNVWAKQTVNPTVDANMGVSALNDKFGGASLSIATRLGTSANYTLRADPIGGNYALQPGNLFTLEGWLLWNGSTDARIAVGGVNDSGGGLIAEIRMFAGSQFQFNTNLAGTDSQVASIPINEWVHLAMTYDGTIKRWFVGGALMGSATISAGSAKTVGAYRLFNVASGNAIAPVAYVDDIRFTFDVCRYAASFTPPDKAFPNTGS